MFEGYRDALASSKDASCVDCIEVLSVCLYDIEYACTD